MGGVRPVGRPRKTWEEVVKEDMKELRLCRHMALDRVTCITALCSKTATSPNWFYKMPIADDDKDDI